MTNYRPGDLVLVNFPFADGTQTKTRPTLVSHDVLIADWQGAGLLAPSVIRLHKIITLEKTKVIRALGTLQPADRQNVSTVLGHTFGNW